MVFSHQLAFALVLVAFACSFSGANGVCVDGGSTYNPGQKYVNAACNAYCTCHSGGGISCVSLCPPQHVQCTAGQTIKYKEEPVAASDGRCHCAVPYCSD